jgi:hypothetical protein
VIRRWRRKGGDAYQKEYASHPFLAGIAGGISLCDRDHVARNSYCEPCALHPASGGTPRAEPVTLWLEVKDRSGGPRLRHRLPLFVLPAIEGDVVRRTIAVSSP